jgi:YfiH family protein
MHWIVPNWPAPSHVKALTTLRTGGVSAKPFDNFNLGDHVGDNPDTVQENRKRLILEGNLPKAPCWISQVHGIEVINLDDYASWIAKHPHSVPTADASISFKPRQVSSVLTADCLPLLLCDKRGTQVAAVHAGWRGLAQGVIQATVAKFNCDSADILAWMGPAIGPNAFEVGLDMKEAFTMKGDEAAFKAQGKDNKDNKSPKWTADLYALARIRLQSLGITEIYGGDHCTYTEEDKFFSFRRSNPTGRQATLIWLES